MKNKKTKILAVLILFFGLGFSLNANAGCCVNGDNCFNASKQSDCTAGYVFSSSDCSCKNNSTTSSTGETPIEFVNPIGWTSVQELVDSLLNHLMGIIAFIAVIFIIVGGIMYMTSGGNETMVTRAKKTIAGAVIGLAIALASPTFLKEIKAVLGKNGSGTGGSANSWVANALTIKDIAINVLNLLLSVVGILGIIALVIGGGMYFTAYGSEKKIDNAKKIVTYAIIGIIVSLASLVIIKQVNNLLNPNSATSTTSNTFKNSCTGEGTACNVVEGTVSTAGTCQNSVCVKNTPTFQNSCSGADGSNCTVMEGANSFSGVCQSGICNKTY